jgi:hypothetical protein
MPKAATATQTASTAGSASAGSTESTESTESTGGTAVAVATKPRAARSRSARAAARAVVPVALGSLTQPGARQGASCQVCGSARVTSLALTLTDGTPVEFTSCHACEHRSWFSPTGELDRATVLDKARKIR